MRKESYDKLEGNSQFEGYAIDLIQEISEILKFNYTIRLAPDGRYGGYNKETQWEQNLNHKQPARLIYFSGYSEWDGMIKELLDQRADIAIADLTITYNREQVGH